MKNLVFLPDPEFSCRLKTAKNNGGWGGMELELWRPNLFGL
jgi:hypothetical protein